MIAFGLLVIGISATSASEAPDCREESARIVSRHKAVFTKPPRGDRGYSSDAVILGNGDLAIGISSVPLPRDSKLKQPGPENIRFWFHKNDFWSIDGPTRGRLFATLDFEFRFDTRKKPPPEYRVETDLYTGTTRGTLSQEGGPTLEFKAWVSAVENMFFIELTSRGGQIYYKSNMYVRRDDSEFLERSFDGDGMLLQRLIKGRIPSGMAVCMRHFGSRKTRRGTSVGDKRELFAFAADSLIKNPDYVDAVVETMTAFEEPQLDEKYAAHKDWWADFWARSFVELPDTPAAKAIEKQYYVATYVLACFCRDRDFPPGILGSVFCTDGPGWANDYHLNYNFQAAFYSLFGSNHVEQGEVQDQPLLDYMGKGRALSKERLGIPGILYPVGIGPKGSTTWGNDYGQRTNASYGAVNMIFRWKTTYDLAYARKVYPYFKELTTFWEAFMIFEKENDRYVIAKDSIHEASGKDFNSIVSLALARAVFENAIELGSALGVDRDRHEKWRHVLDHLSGYATREADGMRIFRYAERGTEYWRGNTLGIQHIYPALGIGLESDPELIETSRNMIKYMGRWFDNNGDNSFFPAAAYVGYEPETTYSKLGEYAAKHYRPNGLRENKHGSEKLSTIPNTVNMMLCSVHRGVMRLFPAWPKDVDARFGNLRQFGAFLVASEIKGGVVQRVDVFSEKGRDLTIVNPWPGRFVAVKRGGHRGETVSGERLVLKTRPGESLRLTPR
ncbi:MAG: glycosyl hydrolase family 95 catalytic domain-containing protein [Planctomycetota bacterium]|jgi:hypothetical protein